MSQRYFRLAEYTTKTKPKPKPNPKKELSLGLVLGFGLVCTPLGKNTVGSFLVVPVKNSVPSDKNSTWNPTCFHIYGEHLYVLTYTKANVLTKAKHTIGILHTPRSLNLQQQITDYKYHRRLD